MHLRLSKICGNDFASIWGNVMMSYMCICHRLNNAFSGGFLTHQQYLYPRHLCRGVYSFRLSVRMFVCSFVRLFVRSYFLPSRGICVKVLRQSFSSGVYLSNYSSESIHIWTIVTLEGWHSLHDHGPRGPCPGVGLEVKI